MKVKTTSASHIVHTTKPYARPPMPRRNSAHADTFERKHRRAHAPPMRRTQSAPAVPQHTARIEPVEGFTAAPDMPSCAADAAMLGAKVTTVCDRTVEATLIFAQWLVELLIDLLIDRVGQRLAPHGSPGHLAGLRRTMGS